MRIIIRGISLFEKQRQEQKKMINKLKHKYAKTSSTAHLFNMNRMSTYNSN
jgi:hypothetical protein